MISILVLQDLHKTFEIVENRVRYMGRRDGIDVSVRQLKSKTALDDALHNFADTPVVLCCDVVEGSADAVRDLRGYLNTLWQDTSSTWMGKRPLIIFSRDDALSDQMGKTAHRHYRAHSKVIRQVSSPGNDPLEILKEALSDALNACNQE